MDQYTDSILLEVKELMDLDNYDENKRINLIQVVKQCITTEKYMESIKKDMDKIFEDKKITNSDVPKMIIVSIKLNNVLASSLNISQKLETSQMKYIVYAVLYLYIIASIQSEFFEEVSLDEFRLLFSNMWSLIEIDPETVKLAKAKFSAFCCSKSAVKDQNAPM
jgi:hypothetical protein